MSEQPPAFCVKVRYFIISAPHSPHLHIKEWVFQHSVCHSLLHHYSSFPACPLTITVRNHLVRHRYVAVFVILRQWGMVGGLSDNQYKNVIIQMPFCWMGTCVSGWVGVLSPNVNSQMFQPELLCQQSYWFKAAKVDKHIFAFGVIMVIIILTCLFK